ncbi:MAG: recombinase family protein, partial [Pirellulaceae bacterium]|nr:recombinase family protein [Pirellulaceae bacterium]
MLKRSFDPTLVYLVVVYLRMSSESQNKRSPKQQLREIKKRLKALGYKWVIVKVYRDNAKSGKYLRNRHGYQQMMRDLKSRVVAADLILVDTLERFGRVEELQAIRKELDEQFGVLVLTGDTNFADPNTPQGKALGMFEAMRASEHGRILGHNVLRGKRDAALQGHWPGGPPPFGYMLESKMKTVKGREEVDYCVLIPNPETKWIIGALFNKAAETSWGTTRLAKFLNEHPEIPKKFKPFHTETTGNRLDNPIYYGELLWERNATGVVADVRVVERNAEEDMLRVPEFCEPIVDRETWEQVQAIRQIRRNRVAEKRRPRGEANGKQIEPSAPGLSLKYLLSGLVFCSECGLRMTASSSSKYVTKSGEERLYVS